MPRRYHVYILANKGRNVLYVGVTGNLERRLHEHRHPDDRSFTGRYRVKYLMHLEETDDIMVAIEREKQIKSWARAKKDKLISASNPHWEDISETLFQ
jgi:putative endonuclease